MNSGVVNSGVVVGIGMSSRATNTEVADALRAALSSAGHVLSDVECVATRNRLVADPRLPTGIPQRGIEDDALITASEPTERTVGIPARVAQTSALLAAGRIGARHTAGDPAHVELLVGRLITTHHVTVAVAELAPSLVAHDDTGEVQ